MIIFLILAGDKTEWTGQLLADVAILLTTDAQGETKASSREVAIFIQSIYKVSQKKWNLLLLLQVVNPTFLGTPCSNFY